MNLKELKEEFSKQVHPSWIEVLSKNNFKGFKRDIYNDFLKRIEIIKKFKDLYKSEIIEINAEFHIKELQYKNYKENDIPKRLIILVIVTPITYFLISTFTNFNAILIWLFALFTWALFTWLIVWEKKVISSDERNEYDWLILRNNEEISKLEKAVFNELKEIEKSESREYIQNMNPYEFEHLTAKIFTHFWYVAKVTKWSWDKWVDINLEKNWERQIVQCKRYKKRIWTPIVRDFIWTMSLSWIHTWFIVTTSDFSFEVVSLLLDWQHKVELIDIETLIILLKMMNDWDKCKDLLEVVNEGMKNIRSNAAESEYNQAIARLNYRWSYKR